MNRFKRIYILLVVLALACAATFAMTRYEAKQEQIKNSGETILALPGDSVTALSWEYAGGGGLAFHKGENGWLYDEDEAFPVSEEAVADLLSHFEDFSSTFRIENVEDYGQYGLDEPECTIHLTAGEETHDIKLGDFSKMDEQRYVDIGDGNVYLVPKDPMDYVPSALSGMIQNDDAPGFETVKEITFTGNADYTVTRVDDSTDTYSSEDIYFAEQDGKPSPLNTASVRQYLNTVTSLDLMDYVTYNATGEELKTYGLDDPELSCTIQYVETGEDGVQSDKTFVFHISRNPEELAAAQEAEAKGENAEAVTKYVRVGDSQIVYKLDDVDYGILSDASYNDLRHKEVIWADFADITKIEVTLEGQRHTLSSVLDEKEEERSWYYGDEPIPPEADATGETGETAETEAPRESLDMSAFQTALNALSATSFTEEAPSGKEEIALTVHLDNENQPKVEIQLYRYDGESCLAVVDGKSVSLVKRANVVDLMEAVNAIVL